MSRVRYNEPGRPVYCSGTNRKGEPCGHKVPSSGQNCWWHRRRAAAGAVPGETQR